MAQSGRSSIRWPTPFSRSSVARRMESRSTWRGCRFGRDRHPALGSYLSTLCRFDRFIQSLCIAPETIPLQEVVVETLVRTIIVFPLPRGGVGGYSHCRVAQPLEGMRIGAISQFVT